MCPFFCVDSWLEVLQFDNDELPAQMVVGNGGTKLIDNYINQSSIPYIDLKVGNPEYGIQARVKRGLTLKEFGYSIMERDDDGAYEVKFYIFKGNNTNYSMEALNFTLPIPKGLRSASTTTAPTDTLATTPNGASTPSPSSPSPSSATSSTSSAGVSLFASFVVVVSSWAHF